MSLATKLMTTNLTGCQIEFSGFLIDQLVWIELARRYDDGVGNRRWPPLI